MKKASWMSRIVPVGTRICAVAIEKEHVSNGGIVLPDGTSESGGDFEVAQVFAVGPGIYTLTGELIPCGVEPGDVVKFFRVSKLQESSYQGHRYYCIDEKDIQHKILETVDE